jgi:hypothetical protein
MAIRNLGRSISPLWILVYHGGIPIKDSLSAIVPAFHGAPDPFFSGLLDSTTLCVSIAAAAIP